MKEEIEKRIAELDEKASNSFDEKFNYIRYRINREKLLELLDLFTD